jgi:hypothetical protein
MFVCVCINVHTHTHTHTHTHKHTHTYMFLCERVYVFVYVYVCCMFVCVCVCVCDMYVCMRMHPRTHIINIHACVYEAREDQIPYSGRNSAICVLPQGHSLLLVLQMNEHWPIPPNQCCSAQQHTSHSAFHLRHEAKNCSYSNRKHRLLEFGHSVISQLTRRQKTSLRAVLLIPHRSNAASPLLIMFKVCPHLPTGISPE